VELVYGVTSLLYLPLMISMTLWFWHHYCERWLKNYVDPSLIGLLAWTVVVALAIPMILGFAGEIRKYAIQEKQ
jgi:hypothetical protein